MNKALRVILNILIVIAAVVFFICLLDLGFSISYANREIEDPAETFAGVLDYEIGHRAYGEVMGHYYSQRMKSFEPPAGYEDLYHVGEYAHTAFMSRVCDKKGDEAKASLYREKNGKAGNELGTYEYTAGEVDEMINGRM